MTRSSYARMGSRPRGDEGLRVWLRKAMRSSIMRGLSEPYYLALILGSLLLSIASFFTTFSGMLNFMPVTSITFCIVFAIQALLFVTSWRIGFELVSRGPTPWMSLFVFAVCFATSVFFSWVALFETINDEELQARTREIRIHRAVEDTASTLRARSQDALRSQVKEMRESSEFDDWRARVNGVIELSAGGREAIEEQRSDERLAITEQIAAKNAQLKQAQGLQAKDDQAIVDTRRALERKERELANAEQRVEDTRVELVSLEDQAISKKAEMDAEENAGGSDRAAGRGPVWRRLDREWKQLLALRDAQQSRLSQAEAQRDALYDERQELLSQAEGGVASGASALISGLQAEIARLEEKRDSIGETSSGADVLEADAAGIRRNLAMFDANLELAAFDEASAGCDRLVEEMRKAPTLRGRLDQTACDRTALAPYLNPIQTAAAGVERLTSQCGDGAGGSGARISDLQFDAAVAYGRMCIDASGLQASQVEDLRTEIARLVLEEDPNASRFVKTVNAFTGGEKLSYFALAIAAAIDALVLFSGLIGAGSRRGEEGMARSVSDALALNLRFDQTDDDDVRNAKQILRLAEALPQTWGGRARGHSKFTAIIDLAEIEHEPTRGQARNVLRALCENKQAAPDPRARDHFLLRPGALDTLREKVAKATRAHARRKKAEGDLESFEALLNAQSGKKGSQGSLRIVSDSGDVRAMRQANTPQMKVVGGRDTQDLDQTAAATVSAAPLAAVEQTPVVMSEPTEAPEIEEEISQSPAQTADVLSDEDAYMADIIKRTS